MSTLEVVREEEVEEEEEFSMVEEVHMEEDNLLAWDRTDSVGSASVEPKLSVKKLASEITFLVQSGSCIRVYITQYS